jgi:hypothetical protein
MFPVLVKLQELLIAADNSMVIHKCVEDAWACRS